MNPDPDYSTAYVEIITDHPDGLKGHGHSFTLGRGTELCVAAINSWKPFVIGKSLEEIQKDMRGFWRHMTRDS
jgi:L-fuconate dehydratase